MSNKINPAWDGILGAYGFGESATFTKRKAKVQPKPFDPIAFAECYNFIVSDPYRMHIGNERVRNEVRALGESFGDDIKAGAKEIKAKVQAGAEKVIKVLKELIDKAIRFFTETIRYMFSNEKKIGKNIVKWNALLKRGPVDAKDADKKIKVAILGSAGNDFIKDTAKKAQSNTDFSSDVVDKITSKLVSGFSKFKEREYVQEAAAEILANMKEDEKRLSSQVLEDFLNKDNLVEYTYANAYDRLKEDLEEMRDFLDINRRNESSNMKALNAIIRDLKAQKKELEKKFKEDNKGKEVSDEENTRHQVQRACLTEAVKLTAYYRGSRDRIIGKYLKIGNKLADQFEKVSK